MTAIKLVDADKLTKDDMPLVIWHALSEPTCCIGALARLRIVARNSIRSMSSGRAKPPAVAHTVSTTRHCVVLGPRNPGLIPTHHHATKL